MNFFKNNFNSNKLKRVLILPVNTGGTIFYIKESIKLLNYQTDILTFTTHPFGYQKNKIIFKSSNNFFIRELKKILSLRYYFFYKNIVFNYGRTIFYREPIDKRTNIIFLNFIKNLYYLFMQKIEISIIKFLNNRVIVIYSGDDARQGDYCLKNYDISPAHNLLGTSYYSKYKDQIKINNINKMNQIAYSIYALNPDIINVLPKRCKFMPYPYIEKSSFKKSTFSKVIKILHVPSHKGVKGTEMISKELKKLKYNKPELNFEFTILENINHFELLETLKEYDLVIDQILVGWYGSIAVEALSKGIPVMAFLRKKDMKLLPKGMATDIPIINISKVNLNNKIIEFCKFTNKEKLALSKESKMFVQKWHSIDYCAGLLKNDLLKDKS